jgi:hypothetical protein
MGRKITPPDPNKRILIEGQSERIADLIGVDAEEIMIDPSYGVLLKPSQVDSLLALIEGQTATLKTIKTSMAEAFDNIDKLTGLGKYKCTHRCMEGKHCGGCGCVGCGYTA